MSSGIYSFYDHLVCGYMRKGLADCCSSNRFFLISNFWCKEHLMNFVTDYIQALLFAAITLTFQIHICQIHIPFAKYIFHIGIFFQCIQLVQLDASSEKMNIYNIILAKKYVLVAFLYSKSCLLLFVNSKMI